MRPRQTLPSAPGGSLVVSPLLIAGHFPSAVPSELTKLAHIVRDTVFLDGGSIWWSQGLRTGELRQTREGEFHRTSKHS